LKEGLVVCDTVASRGCTAFGAVLQYSTYAYTYRYKHILCVCM